MYFLIPSIKQQEKELQTNSLFNLNTIKLEQNRLLAIHENGGNSVTVLHF